MANFGASPHSKCSFSTMPLTTPHLLHCIIHLSEMNILLFASQGHMLSDHTCVDGQEHVSFPF